MAKKKKISRKKLLKEPDEFISVSSKILNYFVKNKVVFISVIGVIFGTILVVSGVFYFSGKAESEAFAMMRKGLSRYQTVLEEDDPKEAYDTVGKDFKRIIDDYGTRMGGKLARMTYAGIAYDAGDYDKAISLYSQALEDSIDYPSLTNLVLQGLGYCYEAKKDYPSAIKYFKRIATGGDPLLKPDACFNLGRIYALTGDSAKSREFYKKIVAEYPDFIFINIVKDKIRHSQAAES